MLNRVEAHAANVRKRLDKISYESVYWSMMIIFPRDRELSGFINPAFISSPGMESFNLISWIKKFMDFKISIRKIRKMYSPTWSNNWQLLNNPKTREKQTLKVRANPKRQKRKKSSRRRNRLRKKKSQLKKKRNQSKKSQKQEQQDQQEPPVKLHSIPSNPHHNPNLNQQS